MLTRELKMKNAYLVFIISSILKGRQVVDLNLNGAIQYLVFLFEKFRD